LSKGKGLQPEIRQGSLNQRASNLLSDIFDALVEVPMDWFSVVMMIAGVGSLATSLIIAAASITLFARRSRRDLTLEGAAG
jgi:hypothetical protein